MPAPETPATAAARPKRRPTSRAWRSRRRFSAARTALVLMCRRRNSSACWKARSRSKSVALDRVAVLVAAFDEAALGFERAEILPGELLADVVERLAGGVEAGDKPFINSQSFA